MDARRALVAGLHGAVATGTFYGFSVYSMALKHQCGLSQSALARVNTLPYAFGLVSPVVGGIGRLIGARGALLLGGVLEAIALCLQYALATHCDGALRPAAPVLLVLCSCLTYLGTILITSVAFPLPVQHWPRNRSQVTASIKSFVGLGGAVVSQAFRLVYGEPSERPTALHCMLLWAAIALGCCSFGAACLPGTAHAASSEPKRALNFVFCESALLGLVATLTPLLTKTTTPE